MSNAPATPATSIRPGAYVSGQVVGDSEQRNITTKKGKILIMVTTQVLAGVRFARCTQMYDQTQIPKLFKHGETFIGEIIPDLDADGQLVVNTKAV